MLPAMLLERLVSLVVQCDKEVSTNPFLEQRERESCKVVPERK